MVEAVSPAVSSQLALLEASVAKKQKKEELRAIQDGIAGYIEEVEGTHQKQLTDKEEENDTAIVETPEIPKETSLFFKRWA